MSADKTWVLVADASRASILRIQGPDRQLQPVFKEDFVHAHLASHEIGSDRPGRTFDSLGAGRHAKEPATDPAQVETERFAHQLAEVLETARKKQSITRLILVAPPRFLGVLRAALPEAVGTMVVAEVNKELTKLTPLELSERLEDVLSN